MQNPALLATERMSDRGLWLELLGDLALLSGSQPGELDYKTRSGATRRAYECAVELHLRGQQLALDV